MSTLDWIILALIFILPFAVIIWVFVKRKRLFYNMHFSALTTWMNYQNQSKYRAMELVQYQQEEEEAEDVKGEKKGKYN